MNAVTTCDLDAFYRGRRVLVTGHTGFKGAWLCEWLLSLGADVTGLSLPAEAQPNLFEVLGLQERVLHHELDLLDRDGVRQLVRILRPDVVLHLAAQSLVRRSYAEPLRTLDTNVTGTANLLAAVGAAGYTADAPCAFVCVTSDKCYENDETGDPCSEGQPMGGYDLYSASKGMVELLATAWRRSFYARRDGAPSVRLATARAGNVLGGGDWAADRIVPDAISALGRGEPILVRAPHSVRPWQHVLEPLGGYLRLGERLFRTPHTCESGWNFGPGPRGERTVGELCDALVAAWGSGRWQVADASAAQHEARLLRLSIDKARTGLGWRPTWDFATTVRQVVEWYRTGLECGHDHDTMRALTEAQIAAFTAARDRQPQRAQRGSPVLVPADGDDRR